MFRSNERNRQEEEQNMKCLLCGSDTKEFKIWKEREFLQCTHCESLMVTLDSYLSLEDEKKRYEEHENDVEDIGYQTFVSPIVNEVLKHQKSDDVGLDFGAGTGPVITKLLKDSGYQIEIYDPFFANDQEKLKKAYDYIVCCEVMEHFHQPIKEFKTLRALLKPGGTLYLKTKLYGSHVKFDGWNYKNDPTHVFIYHEKALHYIKETFGFSEVILDGDMIIYKTK